MQEAKPYTPEQRFDASLERRLHAITGAFESGSIDVVKCLRWKYEAVEEYKEVLTRQYKDEEPS